MRNASKMYHTGLLEHRTTTPHAQLHDDCALKKQGSWHHYQKCHNRLALNSVYLPTPPLKLCAICAQLSASALWDNRERNLGDYGENVIKHQPSYSALKASAAAGCELCTVLLDAVARNYRRGWRLSVDETHATIRSGIKPSQA